MTFGRRLLLSLLCVFVRHHSVTEIYRRRVPMNSGTDVKDNLLDQSSAASRSTEIFRLALHNRWSLHG